MFGLGALSPIETMRATVQEKIADFLAARARLIRLMKNPSLQIQSQANGLYAVQVELERQLQSDIYPKLTAIQSGVWDFSDLALLGGFSLAMVNQIKNVNSLDAQGGGRVVESDSFFNWQTIAIGGVALVVLGVGSGYLFSRR